MAEISDLSGTDASNTGRFPENQAPSTVNNGARALEGMLGRAFKDTIDGAITTGGTTTAYTVAANRTIAAYYDGLTLCVEWDQTCGTTPTVNVNSIGAKSIYWPDGTQVTTGDLVSGGRSIIQYDGTNFQVLSAMTPPTSSAINIVDDTSPQLGGVLDTNSKSINESKGANIASATETDIWSGDGNTVHITGTTTITDFADAPRIGAWRKLIFDGALTLTHGSGITLPGSANITTATGDIAFVFANTVSAFQVLYFKADGSPVAGSGSDVQSFTSSGTWTKPTSGSLALVEVWGAGGSGGTGSGSDGGAGGGGGAYSSATFALADLGATETVTIGAGGAAQTSGGTGGNAGGNTTFGSHLTGYGGGGGGSHTGQGGGGGGGLLSAGATGSGGVGGAGGGPSGGAGGNTSAGGDSNFGGGGGGDNDFTGGATVNGGGGGGGGGTGSGANTGGDSFNGGGGGGGAGKAGGTSTLGGDGSAGVTGSNNSSAGTQPGGASGGAITGTTGAGGDGMCRITVF